MSSRYQLKLESDSLAVVAVETEMMSGEGQDRENAPPSADATRLTNAARDDGAQKSPSKMIQDFEDLFHQELMEVERAGKVFAAWKELKRVVLMRVLDASLRPTTTTKTRDTAPSYAEMLKMKSNLIIKTVFK